MACGVTELDPHDRSSDIDVALLTGGGDRPYAFGLATALMSQGIVMDLIGSDELDCPTFHNKPKIQFLNLRGDQKSNVGFLRKVLRVSVYYVKLISYAAKSKPRIFHILWNNKFQFFDRTILMLYYKLLGKKTILTVHNVNIRKRDSKDTAFNRLTLLIQYRLCDHLFVHTEKMKFDLLTQFGVQESRITIIPFGINNSVPDTRLTPVQAKRRLGIDEGFRTILFFGNIAPYKGLEYLIKAFQQLRDRAEKYHLVIAGQPKASKEYWAEIEWMIRADVERGRILLRAGYIPDDEIEVYFKAADVLALPYRYIYQSGVLFLGHSFGLPALVADVGSLKDDIMEGKTGFVFQSEDPEDLARVIERYFASDLFANLSCRRQEIRDYATERHSWGAVAQTTVNIYAILLGSPYS